MAARRGGLGKGLDSLIPETIKPTPQEKTKVVEKVVEKIVEKPIEMKVKLSKIGPREDQPRKQFDEDTLAELAEPSSRLVLYSPWWYRKRMDFMKLSQANARWRAAKIAGTQGGTCYRKKIFGSGDYGNFSD